MFDGTDPNGTWRLFVAASDDDDHCCYDDGGTATLSGWSLSIDAVDPHAPVGLLSVNGGADTAGSASVALNLDATDPAPATGVKQMRFSNDGTTWSAWQPYARTASWQLTSGDGSKTVWAQFADAGGNVSKPVSDTITLAVDAVAPDVQKANPAVGDKDVKRSASPKVRASEKLRGSTVNKRSVVLKQKGTSKTVKGKVDYKAGRRQIVLNPKGDLDQGTKYVLIVKTTVLDKAGNRFDADPKKAGAQPLRIKFTTR